MQNTTNNFTITAQQGRARTGIVHTQHGDVSTPAFLPCATHGSLRGVPLSTFQPLPKILPNPSRIKYGTGSFQKEGVPLFHKEGLGEILATGDSSKVNSLSSSEVLPGGNPLSFTSEESAETANISQVSPSGLDLQMILVNAYHLSLRPTIDTIEKLGGLHKYMNWYRAILTDSGGFQAFALTKYARYEKEGIRFRSHLDGSEMFLTPETVIDGQQRLGVDIATCLDVCTGFPASESDVASAVDQTNTWAEQSIRARSQKSEDSSQKKMLLYGMVQGSIYPDLRKRSASFLSELPFDGFAIGGNMYTFGETITELAKEKPQMWETVAYTASILPADKPRHLLGVGEPSDLIAGVLAGVDTFDCVMATRIARHGSGWVRVGNTSEVNSLSSSEVSDGRSWQYERINFASARWRLSGLPIDPLCTCQTCQLGYTRAYLQHLLKSGDPLGGQLLSVHNVAFLMKLMEEIRQSITDGTFEALALQHTK